MRIALFMVIFAIRWTVAIDPTVHREISDTQTHRELDLAVKGEGFLPIKMPIRDGGDIGYTRSGHFSVDKNGKLVALDLGGATLNPPVTVPPETTDIEITADGKISVRALSQQNKLMVGRIQLAHFAKPNELGRSSVHREIRLETDGSGPAIIDNPGDHGTGILLQKRIEDPARN